MYMKRSGTAQARCDGACAERWRRSRGRMAFCLALVAIALRTSTMARFMRPSASAVAPLARDAGAAALACASFAPTSAAARRARDKNSWRLGFRSIIGVFRSGQWPSWYVAAGQLLSDGLFAYLCPLGVDRARTGPQTTGHHPSSKAHIQMGSRLQDSLLTF